LKWYPAESFHAPSFSSHDVKPAAVASLQKFLTLACPSAAPMYSPVSCLSIHCACAEGASMGAIAPRTSTTSLLAMLIMATPCMLKTGASRRARYPLVQA
jgi:hypothetical protein